MLVFLFSFFYISKMTPCLRVGCSQPDNSKHRSKYGFLHRALIQTKQQAKQDPKIISLHNLNRKTNDLIHISERENTNEQHQQTMLNRSLNQSGQVHKHAVAMDSFVSPAYNIIAVEGKSFRSSLYFILTTNIC